MWRGGLPESYISISNFFRDSYLHLYLKPERLTQLSFYHRRPNWILASNPLIRNQQLRNADDFNKYLKLLDLKFYDTIHLELALLNNVKKLVSSSLKILLDSKLLQVCHFVKSTCLLKRQSLLHKRKIPRDHMLHILSCTLKVSNLKLFQIPIKSFFNMVVFKLRWIWII
jgi:hypothetical protein